MGLDFVDASQPSSFLNSVYWRVISLVWVLKVSGVGGRWWWCGLNLLLPREKLWVVRSFSTVTHWAGGELCGEIVSWPLLFV